MAMGYHATIAEKTSKDDISNTNRRISICAYANPAINPCPAATPVASPINRTNSPVTKGRTFALAASNRLYIAPCATRAFKAAMCNCATMRVLSNFFANDAILTRANAPYVNVPRAQLRSIWPPALACDVFPNCPIAIPAEEKLLEPISNINLPMGNSAPVVKAPSPNATVAAFRLGIDIGVFPMAVLFARHATKPPLPTRRRFAASWRKSNV